MAVLLGLLVASTYGAGDFFGGLSARRERVPVVVVFSQLCGLPLVAVLVLTTSGQLTGRTLALGAAAGAVGGIGLSCLYRGLASGRMSVVAPITAVGAAIVPLVWGLVHGDRPGRSALAGVAMTIVAIWLISRSADAPLTEGDVESEGGPDHDGETPFLLLAVLAGAAFGTVFVLLAETPGDSGFWPLVAGRSTSILLLAGSALVSGRRLRLPAVRSMATVAPAGVLDMTANALYLLASRRGLLAVVAVLSALYPASTVLLARTVLHERLTRIQLGGLVLAGAGIALIASG